MKKLKSKYPRANLVPYEDGRLFKDLDFIFYLDDWLNWETHSRFIEWYFTRGGRCDVVKEEAWSEVVIAQLT